MEKDSELIEETPDLEFSENIMEQETPDIDFSNNINDEMETPDMEFSENILIDSMEKSHEQRFGADESEIDDMDEPDQYVEDEDDNNDDDDDGDDNEGTRNVSPTNENSESGIQRTPFVQTHNNQNHFTFNLIYLFICFLSLQSFRVKTKANRRQKTHQLTIAWFICPPHVSSI